ncbi:AsnC family transcriptional regulator [Spiribacter salinus M19-40]|uniref:AsnC family transcriptional regulator n=1 Tax=Spiribacter salinus M19-40 TaxID=1260251 RepID=R4V2D4_9GAMM|nr:Lrp/AsnC family transcriptional regulator [Spiribacter salinus]AGM40199.1 AsnC family transcriptional regulator [Spiribacter salinus M19-40]MBY5268570.1 ArsR family transcriptional regulator [Spiribacter salinus]
MSKQHLDRTDLRILEALQDNARLTNVELAERVNLTPSPCLARVRALEASGIIDRYTAEIAPEKLGLNVNVFIHVSLDRQVRNALENFEGAARALPEVMECYLMTGQSDYLLRVLVADAQALERLIVDQLAKIEGVANIQSSLALKVVKSHSRLPVVRTT